MQNLIRIGVTDAADNSRIGECPLQGTVFGRECSTKGIEVAAEDIDSSRIQSLQIPFPGNHVQRCTMFRPGFRKHEGSTRKIEGCQTIASRELCTWRTPVQATG